MLKSVMYERRARGETLIEVMVMEGVRCLLAILLAHAALVDTV